MVSIAGQSVAFPPLWSFPRLRVRFQPGICRPLEPDSVRETNQVSLVSDEEKVKEKERHFREEAAYLIDLETGD